MNQKKLIKLAFFFLMKLVELKEIIKKVIKKIRYSDKWFNYLKWW